MLVGILALQGGVIEHARMVEGLGASARLLRRPADFAGIDALILPGGESTTLGKLIDLFDLRAPLLDAASTLPTLGTCAGLILLSRTGPLGVLDVDVERNAFGPQLDSAEARLPWGGSTDEGVTAAFIRAPAITRVGAGVSVLSTYRERIVGVRQGKVIGVAFHPELTGDERIHRELLAAVESH